MLLNKDKIFNEVFSNYYKVLSEIVNSEPIDELKIDEFISKRSSDDSNQFLHENFENYKFIKKIGNKWQSALESKFEQPLTNLEKSWLKALISDPKIRLFLDEEKISELKELLGDVEPLFDYSCFRYIDRYAESDDFTSEEYIKKFRILYKAIEEKKCLKIVYINIKGETHTEKCVPLKLEYSQKNDKFRLIAIRYRNEKRELNAYNLKRIKEITVEADRAEDENVNPYSEEYFDEPIVVFIWNVRGAISRFMIEFSSYKKESYYYYKEGDSCILHDLYYHTEEKEEIVNKFLSFGSLIDSPYPKSFLNAIKARINKQLALLKENSENEMSAGVSVSLSSEQNRSEKMNSFLEELCAWLNSNRFGRKILLCKNLQTGNQLLRMAASHGIPAVNVQTATVQGYINKLAESSLTLKKLKKIDFVTSSIALQKIMEEFGDDFTTAGKVELTTAEYMLPQLEELERNCVTPEQLETVGEKRLAQVWRKYLNWKQNNGYASETQILELATLPEGVSYALLSNLQFSQVERQFVDKIPEERLTIINVNRTKGVDIPRNAFYQNKVISEEHINFPSCVNCQNIGTEIRWAFQYLIENSISAEEAVIVCPDIAYGLRVAEEGKILGIGVDSAFGMPASMTKTSLLIRCLLDWEKRNYDVEALKPALISGAMALYDKNKRKPVVSGLKMLHIFRSKNIGWGAERWKQLANSEDEQNSLAGKMMSELVSFFEMADRPARTIALQLFALLNQCMPKGIESEFYLNVVDEISRIYNGDMSASHYLSIVDSVASSYRIDSQTSETPKHVYCCRYEDAMYVDRSHFIMLGMNWNVFNKLDQEFPLLHDEEKAKLSSSLRLVGDNAFERRYAVLELLSNRKDARVVFSRARMDYVGGEELMAASIYDDAAKQYPDGKVPQINILERKPLTDLDVYIKSGLMTHVNEFSKDDEQEIMWKQNFENRILSATALETAYECPRKFILKHQMGISDECPESLEQFSHVWLDAINRGKIIHKILESYFKTIAPRVDNVDETLLKKLVEEIVEKYKTAFPVPANITDVSSEVDSILDVAIQEAKEHVRDKKRRTIGTEIEFGDTEPLELSFGAYTIRIKGRIDRVDQTDEGFEIIDYKSGKTSNFREKIDFKLQYYLYTLAWEKLHPDQPIYRAVYDLVDDVNGVEKLYIEMTKNVREKMYQKMIELLNILSNSESAFTSYLDIHKDDSENGNGTKMKCPDYCPFKNICDEIEFKRGGMNICGEEI